MREGAGLAVGALGLRLRRDAAEHDRVRADLDAQSAGVAPVLLERRVGCDGGVEQQDAPCEQARLEPARAAAAATSPASTLAGAAARLLVGRGGRDLTGLDR